MVLMFFISGIFLSKVNDYLMRSDPNISHLCNVKKRLGMPIIHLSNYVKIFFNLGLTEEYVLKFGVLSRSYCSVPELNCCALCYVDAVI